MVSIEEFSLRSSNFPLNPKMVSAWTISLLSFRLREGDRLNATVKVESWRNAILSPAPLWSQSPNSGHHGNQVNLRLREAIGLP